MNQLTDGHAIVFGENVAESGGAAVTVLGDVFNGDPVLVIVLNIGNGVDDNGHRMVFSQGISADHAFSFQSRIHVHV